MLRTLADLQTCSADKHPANQFAEGADMSMSYMNCDGEVCTVDLSVADKRCYEELINETADDIVRTYNAVTNPAGGWLKGEALNWLLPACYDFIQECINNQALHILFRRTLRAGRDQTGIVSDRHEFKSAVLAIFAFDKGAFSEKDRDRYGNLLLYAYRHYVPSAFLKFFRGQEVTAEMARTHLDEDMYDWIIERRSAPGVNGPERGPYPKEIEAHVRVEQIKFIEWANWLSEQGAEAERARLNREDGYQFCGE